MKRMATALVALLVASTLAMAAGDMAAKTATGQIVSVDKAEKMLVVKVAEVDGTTHNQSFIVDDQTKLTKAGQPIDLGQLAQNDRVTLMYRVASGKNVVVNLGVESKT